MSLESQHYQQATERVDELKSFYKKFFSSLFTVILLFAINYVTSPDFWWCIIPIVAIAMGTGKKAVQVFIIGKDWEEQKLREEMERIEAKEEARSWMYER